MRTKRALAAGLLVVTSAAAGQEPPPAMPKTALAVQVGYSTGARDLDGGLIGLTLTHDLGSRLALEAQGALQDGGEMGDAATASASLLFYLRPRTEEAVPYLVAGGGIYHASLDMGRMDRGDRWEDMWSRMSGRLGNWMPGWNPGQRPPIPAGGMGPFEDWFEDRFDTSYTDPAFSVGAGIRIHVGKKIFLRPEARALFVVSDDETRTVGMFTINAGYGF
ncbi:MAG: hypothetical protein NDJ94_22230 [Vicinamibacteria bacterium]|jgi:hypothetical protein|nr:hypothetical protein [Vicinamibacteria bacterium]